MSRYANWPSPPTLRSPANRPCSDTNRNHYLRKEVLSGLSQPTHPIQLLHSAAMMELSGSSIFGMGH